MSRLWTLVVLLVVLVGQCLGPLQATAAVVLPTEETAESTPATELAPASDQTPIVADDVETGLAETTPIPANDQLAAPRGLNFTASVTARDRHGNQLAVGKTVASGAPVTYEFIGHYQAGAPLNNGKFNFFPPAHIRFVSAKLTMANGREHNLKLSDNHYNVVIPAQLNASNSWVRITVSAVADEVDTTFMTERGRAWFSFDGRNRSLDIPVFMIFGLKPLEVDLHQHHFQVKKADDIIIKGQFKRDGGLKSSLITVEVKLDDKVISGFDISGAEQVNREFEHAIPAEKLGVGRHELSFHGIDNHKLQIVPVKLTVQVEGELAFNKVSPQVHFDEVTLSGSSQLTGRQDNWELQVTDTRAENQPWRVMAAVTKLVDDENRPLAGELIYHEDGHEVALNATGMPVAQGQAQATRPVHDIVAGWQADSGILLKTRADALPGNYHGTITWQLEDVPASQ